MSNFSQTAKPVSTGGGTTPTKQKSSTPNKLPPGTGRHLNITQAIKEVNEEEGENTQRNYQGDKINQSPFGNSEQEQKNEQGKPKTPEEEQKTEASAPVISYSLVETMVYEAIEANRNDLYQYARKEIMYNERDAIKALNQQRNQAFSFKDALHLLPPTSHVSSSQQQSHLMLIPPASPSNLRLSSDQHTPNPLQPQPPFRRQSTTSFGSSNNPHNAALKPYDSLYSETPLQLSQATFMLHPSQYQLMFPKDFDNLMNRVSERITSHVSEITSSMLERIFRIHTGLGERSIERSAIKDEVMKEIGAEMQRFQRKYQESRELITTMRKNFLKELQHLRAEQALGKGGSAGMLNDISSSKGQTMARARGGGRMAAVLHQSRGGDDPHSNQQTSLEFSFFSPTEGMDEETCSIFNEHFTRIRQQFEVKLGTLNAINQELAWKVALIDESKKIGDMTAEELIELTFAKQKDRTLLWMQLRVKFTPDDLERIAEEEFADLVNAITEREIISQVQRITEESQFQIKDAKEKMQKEINVLRMQLANAAEEMEKIKMMKIVEIDRAREMGYHKAEQRFIDNMKIKEMKFFEEKMRLEKQLQDAKKEDIENYNKLLMMHALTKWRLIIQISRLKEGKEAELTLEDILQKIQKGYANQYLKQVEELQSVLEEQKIEEQRLRAEVEQLKYKQQDKDDKIEYLMRELAKVQDETVKTKAHADSMSTEVRALQDDIEQQIRAKKSLQELVNNLEIDKADLEERMRVMRQQQMELQQPFNQPQPNQGQIISGQGQLRSNDSFSEEKTPTGAPIQHLASGLSLSSSRVGGATGGQYLGPPIHGGGGTTTNLLANSITMQLPSLDAGYVSDASSKSTKQGGGGTFKFNSKLYAQKQLENMIETRQNTMGKVYASSQLNAAVDTSDLICNIGRSTQYKNKHHDPDFEAKERAKQKVFVDSQTQIETGELIDPNAQKRLPSAAGERSKKGSSLKLGADGESFHQEDDDIIIDIDKAQNEVGNNEIEGFNNQMMTGTFQGISNANVPMKTVTVEEFNQMLNFKTFKTQVMYQLEEERRQTTMLRQALQETEEKFEQTLNKLNFAQKKLTTNVQNNREGYRKNAKRVLTKPQQQPEQDNLSSDKDPDDSSQLFSECDLSKLQDQLKSATISQDEYGKALNYMSNGQNKKHQRAQSTLNPSQPLDDNNLPQVYRRLWDNVEKRSKKAKELSKAIESQRQTEWLKILLTNGTLNMDETYTKSEVLKQLTLFRERQAKQNSSSLFMINGRQQVSLNPKHNQSNLNEKELQKVIQMHDQQQEAMYLQAIQKWQSSQNKQQADQQFNNEPVVDHPVETHPLIQSQQAQQKEQPNAIQTDYASMYITEQQNLYNQTFQGHPGQQYVPPSDDKCVQTDFYLLETLFVNQADQVFQPSSNLPFNTGGQPAYQQRMNQYLVNKQQMYSNGGVSSVSSMRTQSALNYNQQSRAIISNPVFEQLPEGELIIGDPSKLQSNKQSVLFNNTKIKKANSHHTAVITTRQRRSALTKSQLSSPPVGLQSNYILNAGSKKQTLLSTIRTGGDPSINIQTIGSTNNPQSQQSTLLAANDGKRRTQQYQAIPPTNFPHPGGFNQVTLKSTVQKQPTVVQQPLYNASNSFGAGVNYGNAASVVYKDTLNYSDHEDMFNSSELNTMHPSGGMGGSHLTPTMMKVPQVTVNPQRKEGEDLTSEDIQEEEDAQMLFKLISTAGTGFSYIGEKNIKHAARKLVLRKYDPIVNQYVLFSEQKLKK